MSDNQLFVWLSSVGLADGHYDNMRGYGVTEQNFVDLQFQDYDAMGILDAPSRQKLFRLIQNVKRELINKPQNNANTNNQPQQPVQANKSSTTNSSLNVNNNPSVQTRPSVNSNSGRISTASNPGNLSNANSTTGGSRQHIVAKPAILPSHDDGDNYPDYDLEDGLLDSIPAVTTAPIPAPVKQQQPIRRQPEPVQPSAPISIVSPSSNNNFDENEDFEPAEQELEDDEETGEETAPAITNENGEKESKIRVAVRKRPINSKEKMKGELDIASVYRQQSTVVIHEPKVKVDLTKYVESHKFIFDEVFAEEATNEEIYNLTCKPLISFFLNKGKATCFAYGQTGSGKTFTMMGPGASDTSPNAGLYILSARDIYKLINSNPSAYGDLQVWVSFFEIYGGKLFDLLNERGKLLCREDGQKSVNIVGLQEKLCHTVEDLLDCIALGNAVRSTGSTGANVDSSRSHAILQVTLKKKEKLPGQKAKLKLHGKFSFIDLAGSERGADTSNNDRRTRLEGAEINKSLLALKECIRALDQGGKHLPFRGSQLTQVLKDSFMGNSRTIMIANISPNSGSCEHTLNTLRYADRVKELKKGQNSGKGAGFDAYMPHRGNQSNRVQNSDDIDLEEVIAEAKAEQKHHSNANNQIISQSLPAAALPSQFNAKNQLNSNSNSTATATAAQPAKPSGLKKPTGLVAPKGIVGNKSIIGVGTNKLVDLAATHSDLCSTILVEQEALLDSHRAEIDLTMKSVKSEMEILRKQDAEDIDIDLYAEKLEEILLGKLATINELRTKLTVFRQNLKEEAKLSSSLKKGSSNYDDNELGSETITEEEDFDSSSYQTPPQQPQSKLAIPIYGVRK